MPDPAVSAIIGTYNCERHVRQAVESVLSQTFDDYELIIVDDASTDGTLDVLREYKDKRINLVRRETNSGVPAAPRNEGVRKASGQYLAFLDSDDFWYPEKLAVQVEYMRSHPEYALTHTLCHSVTEESEVLHVRREKEMPPDGDYFEMLLRECVVTTSTAVLTRELFNEVGGFNEVADLRRGEDREFFLRAAQRGPFALVREVLAGHRRDDSSISGEKIAFQKSILHTQKWIIDHPDLWHDRAQKSDVVEAYVDKCLEFSWDQQSRAGWGQALYYNLLACGYGPLRPEVWKELTKAAVKGFCGRCGIRLDRRRVERN